MNSLDTVGTMDTEPIETHLGYWMPSAEVEYSIRSVLPGWKCIYALRLNKTIYRLIPVEKVIDRYSWGPLFWTLPAQMQVNYPSPSPLPSPPLNDLCDIR